MSLLGNIFKMAAGRGAGIQGCIKAAESGDAKAQYDLGSFYEQGSLGLTQNYSEAAKWYRKAAEQGHAGAQLYLGSLLANQRDFVEAYKWVTLAKRGNTFDKLAATQGQKRLLALMTPEEIAEGQRLVNQFVPKKGKPIQ
jgi:TPR repeat protein